MSDVWVANASPIIVLSKAGYLNLLKDLSSTLWLPQQVVDEIMAGPPADPARQAIESGWGSRTTPKSIPAELLEWGLGIGETSVLALAQELKPATAVLDDAAARSCAKVFGLSVIGSLGVILRAKKRGILPSAVEAMKALRAAGLHIDDEVIRRALQYVGECQ